MPARRLVFLAGGLAIIGAAHSSSSMNDNVAEPQKCCRSAPAPGREDADLAALSWALAHPARVAIVRLLAERNSCICGEIVGELPLAQSTVSQHLKILKQSGLVCGTVDGPRTCYCLDAKALRRLKRLVARL